jgi:hypothetical protein
VRSRGNLPALLIDGGAVRHVSVVADQDERLRIIRHVAPRQMRIAVATQ